MASVKKYKSGWRVQVKVKGRYRSKVFDTQAEAKAWARDQEQFLGKHGGIVTGRTLADAMDRFAREVSPARKGARWEKIRLKALREYDVCFVQLVDLKPSHIQDFIAKRTEDKVSGATINRELNLIASVLTTARRQWKWMVDSPMRDVRRPKNPEPRDRRISPDEISRILKALDYEGGQPTTQRHHIALAFLFALETGMRQGEIWGLRPEMLKLNQKYLTLPDTKNGTKRDVPLSAEAIRILSLLGDNLFNACSQAVMQKIFGSAVALAGIKDLTFHDSRHEAITRLARKLDILDLARMVGHRDIRSLQTYYNPTASEIAGRLG